MEFKDRLRELRTSRRLSQYQLARALQLSPSTISMIELGERKPSFETEEAIADYFNVDLNYLRGNTDATTKIITGDDHLLLHIFHDLDETSRKLLLTYAQGMYDLQKNKEKEDNENNNTKEN